GIHGYRAFTQEALAATITTEPLGPHHFRATVTLADNSLHMFDLAGDAVYIDAHVLKWRPIGTLLGLETVYELDRIAGRYQAISDERSQQRTVYSLAASKPFDAFDLARRYLVLWPFMDAEYGSATFIGATAQGGTRCEVRVSTTGFLVRRVATNGGGNGIPVQFPREAKVAHHDVGAEGHRHRQSPVTVRRDLDVVAGNLQDAAETLGKVPIVFDDQDPMRPGARFRADRCWRLQLRCSVEQRQANDELGATTATLTARFYSPTVGRDQAAHQSQAET